MFHSLRKGILDLFEAKFRISEEYYRSTSAMILANVPKTPNISVNDNLKGHPANENSPARKIEDPIPDLIVYGGRDICGDGLSRFLHAEGYRLRSTVSLPIGRKY